MAPKRAISYISAFELNPEEELYLIECDVRRKSCVEIADKYHTTVEVVKRRKRWAYEHIADALNSRPVSP